MIARKVRHVILALALVATFCTAAEAREVLFCLAWSDLSGLECKAKENDGWKTSLTIFDLYKQGWRLIATLPRIEEPDRKKSSFIFER